MPHDDLPLNRQTPGLSAGAAPTVMTRTLRLPTASRSRARSIVRMQLDRLSPIPADQVLFDVVPIRNDGAEGLFALGIVRRAALADGDWARQRLITIEALVEGLAVVFRFRNPDGVDDRERRWLQHAPAAAVIGLGLAAVCLAGAMKAETWRARRLPEIAAQQRDAAREDRALRDQIGARADWTALERSDAATGLLCAGQTVARAATGGSLAVTQISADAKGVRLRLPPGTPTRALEGAGAEIEDGSGGAIATVPAEDCA